LALKFQRALTQAGFFSEPIIDIIELLGDDYEPFAQLNYDLADVDFEIMDNLRDPPPLKSTDLLLILSWCFSVAALFAVGIHKHSPTAVKLFAHHSKERILTKLYEPADLILTESLLAHERALVYGMDPAKLLYLPHTYPSECKKISASRAYVNQLAKSQGKSVPKECKVIGCVSRFEYGKNCEFALESVRRLALQKENVVLVLKGDFPEKSSFPDYRPLFLEMLQTYKDEPWLLWDAKPTPYPEVLQEYASFDLLLHPSGAEGASHVVIECLGLQKPVVLLDCSTNPYLFKGIAHFVKTTEELKFGPLPFYIPDMDALCETLKKEVDPPDLDKVRERFDESVLSSRIPLLFERDRHAIQKQYERDLQLYNL
jgi:glycosyltransferase involved in cell wall biosynthesis